MKFIEFDDYLFNQDMIRSIRKADAIRNCNETFFVELILNVCGHHQEHGDGYHFEEFDTSQLRDKRFEEILQELK